jgi:8-hydroxy-5-deazaflavin:NADPH oxidoreductase
VAAKLADAAILAVNCGAAEEALKGGGDLTGKVVVDTSNPITPDYKALTVGHTTSAAAEIQRLVPGARVMRAFNTIFAQLLPAPR